MFTNRESITVKFFCDGEYIAMCNVRGQFEGNPPRQCGTRAYVIRHFKNCSGVYVTDWALICRAQELINACDNASRQVMHKTGGYV